jgi:hypothetical protein
LAYDQKAFGFDRDLCCPHRHRFAPDFLLNLVASANFMLLSLLKGAHPALSCAARQQIRLRSGIRRQFNGFE